MNYENPLVQRDAKSKKTKKNWWAHLDSNQGQTDYESATLTN